LFAFECEVDIVVALVGIVMEQVQPSDLHARRKIRQLVTQELPQSILDAYSWSAVGGVGYDQVSGQSW